MNKIIMGLNNSCKDNFKLNTISDDGVCYT